MSKKALAALVAEMQSLIAEAKVAIRETKRPSGGDAIRGERLSPRLRQTLHGLLQGLSEKQIAKSLNISRHTVHEYVKELHRRYEVTSRGELLALFVADRQNMMTSLLLSQDGDGSN